MAFRTGDVTCCQPSSVGVLTMSRVSAVVVGVSRIAPLASEKVSALPAGTENIMGRPLISSARGKRFAL